MNDDYISGLRKDLVAAAARQQRSGRAARVARPLRPRAWSPAVVLGTAVALAAALVLVVGLRAVSPPPSPAAPKVVRAIQIGGQPGAAAVAAGGVYVADGGNGLVLRLDPERDGPRLVARERGTAALVAADGDTVWVVMHGAGPPAPRSELLQLDARNQRLLARIPYHGLVTAITLGAGGLWLADADRSRVVRIDPRTHARSGLFEDVQVEGVAAREQSLWTRQGETVTERDVRGRVVNRVRGLSRTIGITSQQTLLPDADGAWAVGQSDGVLYRIEGGRVTREVAVGQTAGTLVSSGGAVWVSATTGPDRYQLVRVDPDEGKVTGRVDVGRQPPQAIVPVAKQLWVITGGGGVIVVNPG